MGIETGKLAGGFGKQLVEGFERWMGKRWLRWDAGPKRMSGVHAGGMSSVEFGWDIGDEEDLIRRELESRSNFAIAERFALGAGIGVEIGFDVQGEIAGGGVSEEKFLGEDAAGRKDGDAAALLAPAREGRSDVRVDVTF